VERFGQVVNLPKKPVPFILSAATCARVRGGSVGLPAYCSAQHGSRCCSFVVVLRWEGRRQVHRQLEIAVLLLQVLVLHYICHAGQRAVFRPAMVLRSSCSGDSHRGQNSLLSRGMYEINALAELGKVPSAHAVLRRINSRTHPGKKSECFGTQLSRLA